MRIAIAGAGFAGLAVCYHALKKGMTVTLFDPKGIGNGASGASTGLLHPFVGKSATRSWRSTEGMSETKELLCVSSFALQKPVASYTGIFRPALSIQQNIDFQKNKEGEWREMDIFGQKQMGLWIEEGITVFSRRYLNGLWLSCESMGAQFVREPLSGDFDQIIYAIGADAKDLCNDVPLRTSIGQSLLCRLDRPLPFSMSSHKYLAVTEAPHFCQIGSTYEHGKEPDPKKGRELIEKVGEFYPMSKDLEIEEIRSGKRIAPKEGHRPIVKQIKPRIWVFTGLGSRGLLYHALLGKELINSMR